jgi:hypothetical protein
MTPSLTPPPPFQGNQDPLEIAHIALSPDYFTERYQIRFFQDVDDLDWYLAAFVTLDSGRDIALMSRHRHPNFKDSVGVIVPPGETDPFRVLDEFMRLCDLKGAHLSWVSDYLAFKPRWQVCRTDDNGAEFVVINCWSEEHAQNLVKGFTDRGHKQFYWCRAVQPPPIDSVEIREALDRQKTTSAKSQ